MPGEVLWSERTAAVLRRRRWLRCLWRGLGALAVGGMLIAPAAIYMIPVMIVRALGAMAGASGDVISGVSIGAVVLGALLYVGLMARIPRGEIGRGVIAIDTSTLLVGGVLMCPLVIFAFLSA